MKNGLSPGLYASVLAANTAAMDVELERLYAAEIDCLHIDLMDGHFVSNLTFGPQWIESLLKIPLACKFNLDLHLMLSHPALFLSMLLPLTPQAISIHIEASGFSQELLEAIVQKDFSVGLALNPKTPVEQLWPFLPSIDYVLVMSVQPGFCGQSFQSSVLDKIRQLVHWRSEMDLTFKIQVDGGINLKTGKLCLEAGADSLAVGSALFNSASFLDFHRKLF